MSRQDSVQLRAESVISNGFDQADENRSRQNPAVIIFGPPWPRSGTARVIQNQVRYYRERGYFTVFIAVPFLRYILHLDPAELVEGLKELGADRMFMATLDKRSFTAAKFKASLRHAFSGTVLDWHISVGEAARLDQTHLNFLSELPAVLFHVNHVYTLGFALNLRKRLFGGRSRLPIILETHDVQSHLLQQRGDGNPWTRGHDRLERLIRSESKWLDKANALIHLSVDDFKLFQTALPSKPQFLIFPSIDESFTAAANAGASLNQTIDLMFVGQWHAPNLAAVQWFFEQVWPLIADRAYTVKIVGLVGSMIKSGQPQLYEAFRSCFVGEVADLAPYYRAARCVIAPMVSGSGTSIKTIEAFAMGKPFVGTSKAFRGMPMDRLKEVGIQAYDEPQAFADAIVRALSSEREAQALSLAAYEKVFSFQVSNVSRDEALRAANVLPLRRASPQ
jgi:glycosyltransferase involved in cell wall biosynthesis